VLAARTLDRIVSRHRLREERGHGSGPYMTLMTAVPGPGGAGSAGQIRVGEVRLFTGGPLHKLVAVSLVVPAFRLDSHMIFAFLPDDSPVPHFTLDAVFAGDSHAFHLDLIPRVDLGASLPYMDEVYAPLDAPFATAAGLDGLRPAALGPRQRALMSPWMLAYRATEQAFAQIDRFVEAYLGRWFELCERGVPARAVAIGAPDLVVRNQRNKQALFNPAVDPVWHQVGRLLGSTASERVRQLLID
jgi:hypothetical protein